MCSSDLADVLLSLDWVDLGGTLRQACGEAGTGARVISCSSDHVLHNGWSKDHFALPPVDLMIPAHPDLLVRALHEQLGDGQPDAAGGRRGGWAAAVAPGTGVAVAGDDTDGMPLRRVANGLARALAGRAACLVRLPLGWSGADLEVTGPLDYLGQDGGAGVGSGPGMVVGAALALRESGRLTVGVLGDGDFLMGASALWTAAHYRLPLLIVVANNRSFFNDEIHQERIARQRGRPVENRWLGQQIRDPDPDLAMLARSLGLSGYGPVENPAELPAILEKAVGEAAHGSAVVVDVHVGTQGYPGGVSSKQ